MSRAFVKETDEAVDELPDRPISRHPNLVTAEGLAAIEAQVARVQEEHARASGDRAALAAISRELRYWKSRQLSARLIAAPAKPTQVAFGCTVTFVRADGRRQSYRIVGEDEADPARGSISYVSPVARALVGKQVGDVAEVGDSQLEVMAIS
jgi:transcription elongation GreA/GreB family factor